MPNSCSVCDLPTNENYTLHTFDLYICVPDDGFSGVGDEYMVGDVQSGSFHPEQELKDHYRGQTGTLDARVRLRRYWTIEATCDEITARNMSILLGEDPINADGNCRIPLTGAGVMKNYGARLVHTFPNGINQLVVVFWVAQIVGDWSMDFSDDWASFALTVTSLECEDNEEYPYGYMELTGACPSS